VSNAARLYPLGRAEEEGPVLYDGAAQTSAELIAIEDRPLDVVCVKEGVVGRKRRVAVELVKRAVELVRARLGNHVRDKPGAAPVLGRVVVRLDSEFLDGVERHVLARQGRECVIIFAAVEQEVRRLRALAIDGESRSALVAAVGVAVGSVGRARRERDEVVRVPRYERERRDLSLVYDVR
jgi:hypothetical protein